MFDRPLQEMKDIVDLLRVRKNLWFYGMTKFSKDSGVPYASLMLILEHPEKMLTSEWGEKYAQRIITYAKKVKLI